MKKIILAVSAVLGVLVIAACSGGHGSSPSQASSPGTQAVSQAGATGSDPAGYISWTCTLAPDPTIPGEPIPMGGPWGVLRVVNGSPDAINLTIINVIWTNSQGAQVQVNPDDSTTQIPGNAVVPFESGDDSNFSPPAGATQCAIQYTAAWAS